MLNSGEFSIKYYLVKGWFGYAFARDTGYVDI